MRVHMRVLLACLIVLVVVPASGSASSSTTQNAIAKFGASGTLTDSVIHEYQGNIGIGVQQPWERFQVPGRSLFGKLMVGEMQDTYSTIEDGGTTGLALLARGGFGMQYGIVITEAGNVGIGIQGATERLQVPSRSLFGQVMVGQTQSGFATIEDRGPNGLGLLPTGDLPTGTFITEQGKVGIGTMTPSTRLHVIGDVTVAGNIAAKYQDVAEWVDVPGEPEAGSVIVAAERAGIVSSRAYDTSVIGIVSAQPGVLLGEAAPGRIAVAQSGRVRVKVDASKHPIRVGDLLVTSDVPGHAMRSVAVELGGVSIHRPGTIIGKALEPLTSGRGEILILVTLQ